MPTCPFCPGSVLVPIARQGYRTSRWLGCCCCGCIWNGSVDPANQIHPLAWVPACCHEIPREVVA